MKTSIIRPGLLVSLKTTIKGGVSYQKVDLEHATQEDGSTVKERATWQTTREIVDVKEHEAATVARSKVRSLIVAACCPSSFGLLCPIGQEDKLREATIAAQSIADEFNRNAVHSRIEFYVLAGRVADNDQAAAAAIGSEVRELIDAMQAGVAAADPAAIRDAASRARKLAGMLSPDAQTKVSAAIAEVRDVAKEIIRRVEKAGEQAASVVESIKLDAVHAARFAMLDMTTDGAERVDVAVTGRAIDLDVAPVADAAPVATPAQPSIEL